MAGITVHELDSLFPWLAFFYGLLVTLALNWPGLMEKAGSRLPAQMTRQLMGQRFLAVICLVVGAIWVLQNLWLGGSPLYG